MSERALRVAKFTVHSLVSLTVLISSIVLLATQSAPENLNVIWAGFIGSVLGTWAGKRPSIASKSPPIPPAASDPRPPTIEDPPTTD